MSKEKTIHELSQEINKLNEKIDLKIIRGKSYKKEAKHHKFLVMQLNRLSARVSVYAASRNYRMAAFS